MKLIAEITMEDLGGDEIERYDKPYTLRKSARAVVFNDDGEVSMINATKKNFFKLPGGGVKLGENIEEALRRELLEEVGCEVEILDEVGVIIEYRNMIDQIHVSYCFTAKVVGDVCVPKYTEKEKADGMEPAWLKIDEAINAVKESKPEMIIGKFMVKRELEFLKEVKSKL
ncbi:MAG: NUDIX domain-containing protein [bacterium]